MKSNTLKSSTTLEIMNAPPRNDSVSHSVGWMHTCTPNRENRIIALHFMLRPPLCASLQAAINRIMTGKIITALTRFLLAECLRIV